MASDASFSGGASQTEAQDALTNFWPKMLEELRALGNVCVRLSKNFTNSVLKKKYSRLHDIDCNCSIGLCRSIAQ